MSTVDTSTWNPDADLNTEIEGIPLNADAGIAQTWQVIQMLMAGVAGDGDTLATAIAYALAVAQGKLVGPTSATDGHVAVFDGTSGIQLRDSGYDLSTATQSKAGLMSAADKAYLDSLASVISALDARIAALEE